MDGETAERRWKRRSADRPREIAAAALAEFARRGFAAARMADIAAQAGLSKAALYVYYPTKADLFRAVLAQVAAPRLDAVRNAAHAAAPVAEALEALLDRMVAIVERPELRRLARMVIAESGNFPELASLWRESVVGPAVDTLSALLARGQEAGDVVPGDPRLLAFSVLGPMLIGLLWREVMEPSGAEPLDVRALARQHRTVLAAGLLQPPARVTRPPP